MLFDAGECFGSACVGAGRRWRNMPESSQDAALAGLRLKAARLPAQ